MLQTLYRVIITFCFSCALIVPLRAQQATVQGVVADVTNAVVPAASIKVTNPSTGVSVTVETNDRGFYSVPFLNPGTYELEASATGFATTTLRDLKLDVDQTARLDIVMKIGSVAESIDVSATAALIDSETSTVGQVIDNRRIVELPLNGRNYLELARLTTGVAPDPGSRTGAKGTFSALGQHAYQTNVMLDGVDNNSRASGGQLGYEAQAVTPSIDAVQEFKVITNNNSAEYGFRMGGTVLVQTKSGSNDLHGTAYEFVRNEKLDGTNFFAVGQPKPPYRRNQFGATLGGPVIRNKTFFFGSYEGTRIRQGDTRISTVPTDAMKGGDFSGQPTIYDPSTTRQVNGTWIRDPYPGNRIPASQFDPVAAKVAALYPSPNLPGLTGNYYFSGSNRDDTNQVDGRIDHTLSSGNRMFVRYSRRGYESLAPGNLPLPADGGNWTSTALTSNNVVGNLNSTLTPAVNNELRVGYSKTESTLDIPWTENLNPQLGIKGLADLGDDNGRGMTRFTPSGYAEIGARSFWPNRNNLDFLQLSDHVLKVHGRHVIKTGFEFRREQLFRRAARFSRGQMAFNGSFTQNPNDRGRTGNGFADLLVGFASGGNIGNQNGEKAVALNQSLYFQDDWRINSRLTLNLGVRWDRFGAPSFRDSAVGRFEFANGDPNYRIVRPTDEGDCGCEPDNNNFAPRIGLAYQINTKTVFRSGFGMYYGQPDAIAHDGDARFYNQAPDFLEIGFPTDRLVQPGLVVKDGFPTGLIPSTVVPENNAVRTALPSMPSQYSMQWFADIQRELPGKTVLTLSYIGLGSRHLVVTRNINQPLTPRAGTLKNLRPWPFFTSITLRDPVGKSSYQAFAAKAEKRYSAGVTFLASYTWSHAIDDGAGTLDDGLSGGGLRDNYNLNSHRGNSGYDLRHNFIFSSVYDLPFGKGRSFMNQGGPLDWVLGGWQFGGILMVRSGRPFSPLVNGDISNTGTTNYPNRIGSGELASDQRTIDRWFDVSAFTVPAAYTYGNSGRNFLYGPGFVNADLKIGKNFVFRERYRVEFRCEMFNFTNTPHFGVPASTVNLATAGQIRSAGDPRDIQFGLKLVY